MRDDDAWFAPKLFGIGVGLPLRWQGWALLAAFVGGTALLAWGLLPDHQGVFVGCVALLIGGFLAVAAPHTRGGLRWRWGSDR